MSDCLVHAILDALGHHEKRWFWSCFFFFIFFFYLKYILCDVLKFLYLLFRYQRLVPGRENIAAEHLVPQLGYVATSKNRSNCTQALIRPQSALYKVYRGTRFKNIWILLLHCYRVLTSYCPTHALGSPVWWHLQVMVRWWSRWSVSRLQSTKRLQ